MDELTTAAVPVTVAAPDPGLAPPSVTPVPAVPEPVVDAPAIPAEPAPAEPAEPELKPHTDEPGLLGGDEPPKEPDEQPDAAAAEVKPEAAPLVEPLKYEAPTLPEGVTLDNERLGKFDELIGKDRVSPELRQGLIDLFVGERGEWEKGVLQRQHDAFAETKAQWAREAKSDPEIGGAGFATSIEAADRMIRTFTTDENRSAFLQMLRNTGADSHPEMVRFLVNLAHKFDEPAPAPIPRRPSPDLGKPPGGSRMRDFYTGPGSDKLVR